MNPAGRLPGTSVGPAAGELSRRPSTYDPDGPNQVEAAAVIGLSTSGIKTRVGERRSKAYPAASLAATVGVELSRSSRKVFAHL